MSDVFRALKEISLEVCESYYVCVLTLSSLWLKKIVNDQKPSATWNRGIVSPTSEISSPSDSKITLRSLRSNYYPSQTHYNSRSITNSRKKNDHCKKYSSYCCNTCNCCKCNGNSECQCGMEIFDARFVTFGVRRIELTIQIQIPQVQYG